MYLLDTDVCAGFLQGQVPRTIEVLKTSDPALFGIPAVVVTELLAGAETGAHPRKERRAVERFLVPFAVVPLDEACARSAGRIIGHLAQLGIALGISDLMVAATALAKDAVLVTRDDAVYGRIPGLRVEVWDPFEP